MNAGTASKEKNMGIELLRIVAILMIMALHVMGQGGVLLAATPLSKGYEIAYFWEALSYPSGTIFGIIAGYVGLKASGKISNIVYIWLQVLFYTVIITGIFAFVMPETFGLRAIINMLCPVMTEQYWYISAYIGTMLFAPIINNAVNNMPKKQIDFMFVIAIILFSVLPTLFSTDVFGLRGGCSILCVMTFYFIGAYMRKYELMENLSSGALALVYFLATFATWGCKLFIETVYGFSANYPEKGNILYAFNSPTVIIAGMAIVVLFSRIKLNKTMTKAVGAVAPLTLGAYLINTHPLIFRYIMEDRFASFADYPAWKMLICVILAGLFMALIEFAIDGIRRLIFDLGNLRGKLYAIEKYLFGNKE